MSTTPTTLEEFIGRFENPNFNVGSPFYYEISTNTINFGYGNNVTDAGAGATFRTWLADKGVTISDAAWGYGDRVTVTGLR